jgi:hypothetical protein
MVGRRPSHEGTVTVKDGENWKKIGTCSVWLNDDQSVSGVIVIDANTSQERKVNFRAWKA